MLPTTCHVYFGSGDRRDAGRPPGPAAAVRGHLARCRARTASGPTAVIKSRREDGPPQDRRHAAEHEVHAVAAGRRGRAGQAGRTWCAATSRWTAITCSSTSSAPTTLRKAQANPEQHRDLIVRVAGYSDYFCDLSRELQEEIITRTEHEGF